MEIGDSREIGPLMDLASGLERLHWYLGSIAEAEGVILRR